MSTYASYELSPTDCRLQRVSDIDDLERSLLDQLLSAQIERAIILKTSAVTVLLLLEVTVVPVLAKTA